MTFKRLLPVLTASLLLAGCSPSAQDGEYPVYGDGYDLNTKDGMADYLKEYKTLPDDYIDHDAKELDGNNKPESFEPNAASVKKAGEVTCKNDELLQISKDYFQGDTDKLGEAVMSAGGPEEKYGDVFEALNIPDDAPDNDKYMAAAMTPLGAVMSCGDEFSDEELEKVAASMHPS
ncbi:ribonuclease [Corynebacterium yonathiae]|uniref:Ribonuclease n=1 Tax=Corynebacterium yonathiae TaxID=2913504 RepID=A0A9X3LYL7_9CORY|nr:MULTISPECIES: ribonuclease [Corynebacterium]MCZ9296394.1 ribonuclease [Corynebacterium yonathiae]MDK2583430.1 ribonuclease [Corynebacterium sp. BWA136]